MNSKNIIKILSNKLSDWISSIDDENLRNLLRKNIIVTGGSIVSLLNSEPPNDYDIYLKTPEACLYVSYYYVKKMSKFYGDFTILLTFSNNIDIKIKPSEFNTFNDLLLNISKFDLNNLERIKIYIPSKGIFSVSKINNKTELNDQENSVEDIVKQTENKNKYSVNYITSNAITLSDDIQIIIRFFGDVNKIHENYDFIHCTCFYDWFNNHLELPQKALEAIINKELIYVGSKYPVSSLIRTRKFLNRGYTINAGQYIKMCYQVSKLNLDDINVLEDQLTGVDVIYFNNLLKNLKENNKDINYNYLSEVIDMIF